MTAIAFSVRKAAVLGAGVMGAQQVPQIDPARSEDVVVGCAMPEYEQGMNVARIGLLLAGLPNTVAGMVTMCISTGMGAAGIFEAL